MTIDSSLVQAFATVFLVFVTSWYVYLLYNGERRRGEEHTFNTFLGLLKHYDSIIHKRQDLWSQVENMSRKSGSFPGEDASVIDYFYGRFEEIKPDRTIYGIESELLEYEIKSLNVLNELCRYAISNPQIAELLKAKYSNMISYYLESSGRLLSIVENTKAKAGPRRIFSIPNSKYIEQFSK